MNSKNKFAAIIVSGGSGSRMKSDIPKQYLMLNDKMIVEHTIDVFKSSNHIEGIFLVIAEDASEYIEKIEGVNLVIGGKTRQESVYNGLKAVKKKGGFTHVLIHDAVRPFVESRIINDVSSLLNKNDKAVIPAIKVSDTIKKAIDDKVIETVDRENLYAVQTPQGFHLDSIFALHEEFKGSNLSDDSLLFEQKKMKVSIIEGSKQNYKITTKEDMEMAKNDIGNKSGDIRIGNGFDVHAFEEGDHVIICGIKIPHNKKLKGHSDADVGWHALTDAILGAIGMGDIGEHFSDKDQRWKNADSVKFLKHAYNLANEKGFIIANADITIICEEPKLSNHKGNMKNNTAKALGVKEDSINIKATTTEKLGFTGRKEGIAAQAVVLLKNK